MRIISETPLQVFNVEQFKRGTAIKVKQVGGNIQCMGFVQRVTPHEITIIYPNRQNSAVSNLYITAKEVVEGRWDILWSSDLEVIHHEYYGENKDDEECNT